MQGAGNQESRRIMHIISENVVVIDGYVVLKVDGEGLGTE